MTKRQRAYWVDDNGTPRVSWHDLDEGEDSTFEIVAKRMEGSPDPPVDLWRGLSKLTKKQLFVISLRYGLGGYGEHTLEEISNFMGIAFQNVARLERRALNRLQGEVSAPSYDGIQFQRPA